jgi:uncharacterized pyridoxal phosphate-containing UPF0001 family protein
LVFLTYIHSVDRLSLAEEISKRAVAKNLEQKILLQLNFGDEATKSGASAERVSRTSQRSFPRSSGHSTLRFDGASAACEIRPQLPALSSRQIRKIFEATQAEIAGRKKAIGDRGQCSASFRWAPPVTLSKRLPKEPQ